MITNRTAQVVLILLFLGIVLLFLRFSLKSEESVPTGDSLWQITLTATVKKDNIKSDLHMAIPQDSASTRVTSVSLDHPGFSLKRIFEKRKNQREILARPIVEDEAVFTADFKVHVSNSRRWQHLFNKGITLSPESRVRYLNLSPDINTDDRYFVKALDKLRIDSENETQLIENIFSFTNKEIVSAPAREDVSIENILKLNRADNLGKARTMVALCRSSNIPARLVTGIIINEMIGLDQHYWVEVYQNKRWIPYDPTIGLEEDLHPNYLKLIVDSDTIAYTSDGIPVELSIDSVLIPTPAGLLGTGEKRLINILDFNRLPLNTQFLLASLFLLPFGALITSIFRQMGGVLTYGTFTPSLLAMSTIHAGWLTVIVVVLIVVAVGFASRSAMPEKMARVPRLSIILTIVAIGMGLSISIMDYFILNPDPTIILLPIIVLTNLVDRFYSTNDDKGLLAAIYRLIWTFVITLVCFLMFIIKPLQQFVLSYPEVHLFTLIAIILISKYEGKKLSSLPYFHWLRGPETDKHLKNKHQSLETI